MPVRRKLILLSLTQETGTDLTTFLGEPMVCENNADGCNLPSTRNVIPKIDDRGILEGGWEDKWQQLRKTARL